MNWHRYVLVSLTIIIGIGVAHMLPEAAAVSEAHHGFEGVGHEHASPALPWAVMAAFVALVAMTVPRLPRRFTPLLALLPLAAWLLQEAAERLVGTESMPFAISVKHIALGLLVQVPIALLIYFLVRVAVAVVRKLAQSFAEHPLPRPEAFRPTGAREGFTPRISIVARGSPTRGPPLFVDV